MSTDENRRFGVETIDERRIASVVKLLLVVGALFVMWGLLTNLPGIGRLVPATPVSYAALIGALVTLVIVAALGYVAVKVETLLRTMLAGPAGLVADAASVAKHLLLFVAVVVAYRGLAPLVSPPLDGIDLLWAYDVLFLVLGLVPTAVIAVRMYGNLDEVTDLIVDRLADGTDGSDGTGSDAERSRD